MSIDMLVEYQRRIAELTRTIVELSEEIVIKALEIRETQATLAETQRLYEFYKEEMLGKGRIVPDNSSVDST